MGNYYRHILFIVILCNSTNGQFTHYIKSVGSFFGYGQEDVQEFNDDFLNQNVPYEVAIADEKFISEAAKLTGITLSELDSCQHKVVLKLQKSCDKMNDEQLAKMAVMLLNCQSLVEGRTLFPCTENMSIKDCTVNMDADTWNSYHLMSNRARAVCYSVRQVQFRGLTEYTVNRLMDAARNQLNFLDKLSTDQKNLNNMAQLSLDSVAQGQRELVQQQKDLQMAQLHGQLAIEDNIKRISDEKRLITETNAELTKMTKDMQSKLRETISQMKEQTSDSKNNHQEILDDLTAIQDKAQFIFEKIDTSAQLLLMQSTLIQDHYKTTFQQLSEVNTTVQYLVDLVRSTKKMLENHIQWLSDAFGGTDLAIEKLYALVWHVVFVAFGMIICAFLNTRLITRLLIVTLPILNLILMLQQSAYSFDSVGLFGVLSTVILCEMLTHFITTVAKINMPKRIKEKFSFKRLELQHENNYDTSPDISSNLLNNLKQNHQHGSVNNEISDEDEINLEQVSQVKYSLTRSRSRTPLGLLGTKRAACSARTRMGTPCKLTSLPGRDVCYRHQEGDSIYG